ncbi:MAG: four helix bundle protein [Pseudomonadota bacterium]|nr:four helix bundle protein [Pseudomonadota bacterium]
MADVIDFSNRTLRTPIERTDLYQRAYTLAQEIHKATLDFPEVEQRELGDDVRRAVRAVCTHLVEGFEKQKKASPSFYVEVDILTMVAIDVARKVDFMLRYCRDLGYIDVGRCDRWCEGYGAILHQLQEINEATQEV